MIPTSQALTQSGCGEVELGYGAIAVTRPSRIWVSGDARVSKLVGDPDAAVTLVATLSVNGGPELAFADGAHAPVTTSPNGASIGGLLRTRATGQPYEAAPGTYRLALSSMKSGLCAATVTVGAPELSFMALPTGG